MPLKIGDSIAEFGLKGVDDKIHSTSEFADKKILVVIFTCNHCPYAKAYQGRIMAVQKDYAAKGVQVVAINSNEDSKYTEDSFENMKIRAKEKRFDFPYLRDESQDVARVYGAKVTPHVFVFDASRKLRYVGAIDDNWENANAAKRKYLRESLDAILSNKEIATTETTPVGCSVKWKGWVK
ncbi:MAG: thioredoxin family protein [Candidatus Aenigmarchaeota archaeon]|nr:thioredoxin family protein [Candidatus Aenigmarchaeota archaeon]